MQRHGEQGKLIIRTILSLLGLADEQYAVAVRVDGSVTVVGLDDEADRVFTDQADKIWEVSSKANSSFVLDHAHGYPILTNKHG